MKWISVEDRLPEGDVQQFELLVWIEGSKAIANWDGDSWYVFGDKHGLEDDVTHWMLVEPPEEE